MRKHKVIFKTVTVVLLFTFSIVFANRTEKYFVGSKYSVSAVNRHDKLLLIDPISSEGVLFDLKTKKIEKTFKYVGLYVIHVEPTDDGFIVVDKGDNSLFIITNSGFIKKKLKIDGSILTVLSNSGSKLFLVLEDLEILYVDEKLETLEKVSIVSEFSPILQIPILQIVKDGKKNNSNNISEIFLIVENYLVYKKSGLILDAATGNTFTLAPYISDVLYDVENKSYYFTCSSNSAVYILETFENFRVVKVPYRPSLIRKVRELFCIVSSESDKLLLTKDFVTYQIYDTGVFPKDIFIIQNQCIVYCFESGELIYFQL